MKVKLCGNHSYEDLRHSLASGAKYIGIVFAKESKRTVDPIACEQWINRLVKQRYQQFVGVFVNPTEEEIANVLKHVPLDVIQLHGNESPAFIKKVREKTGLLVWKAIHHDENGLANMKQYDQVADGYVVDAKVKGAWGGTGQAFDWMSIPFYMEEANKQRVVCLIAGGITPDNVKDVLAFNPHGIDLASGIETNGTKDIQKIKLLLERLK